MNVLPGYVADPDWSGPRCKDCGRALGGGGDWPMQSCADFAVNNLPPQAHLTLEAIPAQKKLKWFVPRICSNLLQAGLDQLQAAEWLCSPHPSLGDKRPIDVIRADRALSVFELQFAEWPALKEAALRLKAQGIAA